MSKDIRPLTESKEKLTLQKFIENLHWILDFITMKKEIGG